MAVETVDLDKEAADLFNDLMDGRIDREEYRDSLNDLYEKIPSGQRKSLDYRLDRMSGKGRQLGDFALQVLDSSRREEILVNHWRKRTLEAGIFTRFDLTDFGVGNRGQAIISNSRKGGIHPVDYLIDVDGPEIQGKYRLEIKFAPSASKLTYKINDLKTYIEQNALVLTVIGKSSMLGPNGDPHRLPMIESDLRGVALKWCLFTPAMMDDMLDDFPAQSRPEMGGKQCIQLKSNDFSKYFNLFEF